MSVTLLPDAIWLHCILPKLSSDKDKMALLCTSKAKTRLIPYNVFTPMYDFATRHAVFGALVHFDYTIMRNLYRHVPHLTPRQVAHAMTNDRVPYLVEWATWQEKIPRAILDRELAHPVQLA